MHTLNNNPLIKDSYNKLKTSVRTNMMHSNSDLWECYRNFLIITLMHKNCNNNMNRVTCICHFIEAPATKDFQNGSVLKVFCKCIANKRLAWETYNKKKEIEH